MCVLQICKISKIRNINAYTVLPIRQVDIILVFVY